MSADGAAIGVPEGATDPSTAAVVEAVETAGGRARVASVAELAEADVAAVVAPGEVAFRALGTATPRAPVLPVDCEPGVRAVDGSELHAALTELLEDGPESTDRHDVLAVRVDDESLGLALRQVTLVTAEPAGISEFAVESDDLGDVDEVRADGVVVATPAGSAGYARAGDGPLLAPGTGLAVVPVAPFRTDRPRWVLSADGCAVQIRRDEAAVAVELDGAVRRTVGQDATVGIEHSGSVETAVVGPSGSAFR